MVIGIDYVLVYVQLVCVFTCFFMFTHSAHGSNGVPANVVTFCDILLLPVFHVLRVALPFVFYVVENVISEIAWICCVF